MTYLEQLQNATLESEFFTILHRLVDFSGVPVVDEVQEPLYIIDEDDQLSMYDRITLHASAIKPTLQVMNDDFVIWKSETIVEEEERLAEIVRKQDLSNRFENLDDMSTAYRTLYPNDTNPAIWLRDLQNNSDHGAAETLMVALEAQDLDFKTATDITTNVASAYKIMDDNINVQILAAFGTLDRDSAGAFAQSWRLKKENPAEYTAEGLVALEAIAGFSINDALDTEPKIIDYYTVKLSQLITFDKFRDTEIKTYLIAKAAAEA